ncbi:hypothetical protein ACJMK2_016386 [Sinanodonta woodiana]|uniref:GST C-terminal domain-containing protein n=1 Tax=Sinanodonta woodiana TaxID=1069815 RepID=A0ABD3UTM8_SINWO
MDDLRAEIAKLIHEKESDKRANIQTNLYESVYPKFIGILEHYLGENKCNSGYFLGEELTLADLSVFETWTLPLENHPDLFDDHPELLAHRKRIENDERLSHYIKTRPKRSV